MKMIGIFESDGGTKIRTLGELGDMCDNISDSVRAELELIWREIEQTAIDLCPKDTGSLASTITSIEGSGEGAISATSTSGQEIFNRSLIAGDESVINPKTGKPTSEYAGFVHDGHMIGNMMWEGVPFLTEALLFYEDELEAAVDRAMSELGVNKES